MNNTETAPEILASEITAVAEAARKLLSSRLSKRAILLLIRDSMPQAKRPSLQQIALVLDKAATLDLTYLKRVPTMATLTQTNTPKKREFERSSGGDRYDLNSPQRC